MRAVTRGPISGGSTLHGLTGQGEPGLWTLLGGTSKEQDADSLKLSGGSGQVSAVSRLSLSNGDVRLNGVASGGTAPGTNPVRPPSVRPPPRPER